MNYQSQNKTLIRKKIKSARNFLSTEERKKKSQLISSYVLNHCATIKAQTIFCYISFASEVSTIQILKNFFQLQKTVCVPKIVSGALQPIIVTNLDHLYKNQFGYLEPIANQPITSKIDLCLTPGIAFTISGKRLGYGKGYYDQFFAKHPKFTKIGLAFEIQILADLPTNSNDQLIDLLITEKGVIDCQEQRNLSKKE